MRDEDLSIVDSLPCSFPNKYHHTFCPVTLGSTWTRKKGKKVKRSNFRKKGRKMNGMKKNTEVRKKREHERKKRRKVGKREAGKVAE